MNRLLVWLVLAVALAACSTRSMVVKPDEVPRLGDAQWTVTSEPAAVPR